MASPDPIKAPIYEEKEKAVKNVPAIILAVKDPKAAPDEIPKI